MPDELLGYQTGFMPDIGSLGEFKKDASLVGEARKFFNQPEIER